MSHGSPVSALASLVFPAFPNNGASQQLALQAQFFISERWSIADLRREQARQLDLLLNHAARTTPFYQSRLSAALALPAHDLAGRLAAIPIATRADLREAGAGLNSNQVPPEHGGVVQATTTGSTGIPLRFGRTAAAQAIWKANALREYLWQRRDFSLRLGAIRMLTGLTDDQVAEGIKQPSWGPSVSPVYKTGDSVFFSANRTMEDQLAWLERERPEYLTGYCSGLLMLAEHALRVGKALPPLRELRTIGETVSDEVRQRLTQLWGCPVTDAYTCEEAGYLALQCPSGTHYHEMAESVIIEILDDQNRPCTPGTEGRVVITHLSNFATPFIRYDLGDFAVRGGACTCGRTLPTITRILGRKRNQMTLPDGRKVFPTLGIWTMSETFADAGIRRLRCIQHTTERLEFVLNSERKLTLDEEAKLREIAQSRSGKGFTIDISYNQDPEFWKAGKHEAFFSLIP